ncbi:MAG: polysaccharide deacetylase family protein [Sedimentisphaerales bacterium]|nr:polysaccharide deacetylase family protein [Sedimentisphaerales bacterium]
MNIQRKLLLRRLLVLLSAVVASLTYGTAAANAHESQKYQLRGPVPDRVVVLTFDDAILSHYTYVGPLLKKYGFGATFYISEHPNPPFETNKDKYMAYEQIKSLYDMGFEVANHTKTHAHVNKIDKERFIRELEYIENRFSELGIPKPVTFAYPGYDTDPSALETLTEKGYIFARTGGDKPYNPAVDNPLLVPSYTTRESNEKQIFDALGQAKNGNIVVLTIHGVPDLAHPQVTTPPELFEKYIKFLHENNYTVIAMRDVAKYVDTSSRQDSSEIRRIVVAADGSGQFKTVQAAVDSVPQGNSKPVEIHIKPGIYKEVIVVPRDKRFVRFIGEDAQKTVLTYDLYAGILGDDGRPIGTFRTSSTTIVADDFYAENITFENSAGPVGQAVALTAIGDRAVFRNCRFLGSQDTLLAQTGRQYFEKCFIEGRCDFIFGGSTAFFESCHINCVLKGYITAAATPQHQQYGYVFSNCKITGGTPDAKTYLGRPWRDYANVIFLNTEMSEVVYPAGWDNWRQPNREKTARYAEYNSTGPGANPQVRVPWARQLSDAEAKEITLEKVLGGTDGWDPKTGKVRLPSKVIKTPNNNSTPTKTTYAPSDGTVYMFASCKNNGEDGLHLAYSSDGLKWRDLGDIFLKPETGEKKLMLAPSITQGPDGTFHLIWATGSGDKGFGYACSKDLIHWSRQKFVEIMAHQPQTTYVLAPELFYDDTQRQFLIIWASTILPNYYQAFQEPTNDNSRLWQTTTRDFETFTQAEIFFEPGYSVKDGLLIKDGSRYALIHKDDRSMMENLRVAFGVKSSGPWGQSCDLFTDGLSEGPSVLRIGSEWIIYYYMYEENRYGAIKTTDFRTFTDITVELSFPEDYHQGSAFAASIFILEGLKKTTS